MKNAFRAELYRLARRRNIVRGLLAALLFAGVAGAAVFAAAAESGPPQGQAGTTLTLLGQSGGATAAYAIGAGLGGLLVFVTFIAVIASEFSGGVFRALALREPRRLRLVIGKLGAMVAALAAFLAVAELLTVAVSLLAAAARGVPTGEWFTAAGLGDAARDYLVVLGGLTGWAVFGTTLAVAFRSAPIALAAGFAWAGPLENITVDSWSAGYRVFPGQVLRSVMYGGTDELGLGRAVLTGLVYVAIAGVVCLALVTRRDVTA